MNGSKKLVVENLMIEKSLLNGIHLTNSLTIKLNGKHLATARNEPSIFTSDNTSQSKLLSFYTILIKVIPNYVIVVNTIVIVISVIISLNFCNYFLKIQSIIIILPSYATTMIINDK